MRRRSGRPNGARRVIAWCRGDTRLRVIMRDGSGAGYSSVGEPLPFWRELTLVLSGFTTLALGMTYPLMRHSAAALPSDLGDPLLNTWILAWDANHLLHGLRGLWDTPNFYPYRHTLAFSEHLLGIALLAAPLQWASQNPVLAYNAGFLLSFVIAGSGMYLLARSLCGRPDVAILAGLVYAFCPYRMAQLSRLQVLMSGWMPIALWAWHRYFASWSWRTLLVFVGAFLIQALSNGYFFYFLALPVGLVALYEICQRRPPWRVLGAHFTLAAALILIVLAPVGAAYFQLRRQGFVRAFDEIKYYSADMGSYLRADDSIRIWRGRLPGVATLEGDLFPGLTVLLLAGATTWPRRPRREDSEPQAWRSHLVWRVLVPGLAAAYLAVAAAFGRVETPAAPLALALLTLRLIVPVPNTVAGLYARIAALGCILSLGPQPRGWGGPLVAGGPYLWLMRWVPGFDGLRVPARFAMVVVLGLAVLGAFGAARLLARLPTRARRVALLALGSAILAEGYGGPIEMIPVERGIPVGDRAAYAWLREAAPGAVCEFPIQRPLSFSRLVYPIREGSGYLNTRYQYRTLIHGHPIVNGFSGYEPPFNVVFRRVVEEEPLSHALEMLRAVGVRYLVLHPPESSTQPLARVTSEALYAAKDQVVERRAFGDTFVFQLAKAFEPQQREVGLRPIAPETFRATASHGAIRLRRAFDGNLDTRWLSEGHQAGREWIRIEFDRPRDVARIRLEQGNSLSDYPRELLVESSSGDRMSTCLYQGRVLPQLARGLVRDPRTVPIDIWLPPNRTTILWLRQTGTTRVWYWSIDELTLWER